MIYLLIWSHMLCDFVLQTDNMAKGKSSSNVWLSKHISVYAGSLWFILAWKYALAGACLYCAVNGAAHWMTDWITSRITKRLWQKQQVHNFFVVVGIDQAIHMTTLIATLPLLVKK